MTATLAELPQHLTALERANYIRCGRAELKRGVRAYERDLRELILEAPDVLLTARVFDLLQWLPRVGPERAQRMLRGVCSLTITLEYVGPSTRGRVIDAINDAMCGMRLR